MNFNFWNMQLDTEVELPRIRKTPGTWKSRSYYAKIAKRVLPCHPHYRLDDISGLGLTRRDLRALPAAMSWAYDVLRFTVQEKSMYLAAVTARPVLNACYFRVQRQMRPDKQAWALTSAEVKLVLKLNAEVYKARAIAHATCLVVYLLFVYGVRLVDCLNMLVEDVRITSEAVKVKYWSYKNRKTPESRSIQTLCVPVVDVVGYKWLVNMVDYAVENHDGGRLFHSCTSRLDDYVLGDIDNERLYRYFYAYHKWLFRYLNLDPAGGTHCGRRSIFSNCSDSLVSMLAQQLGIKESTARERYRRPSVASASELFTKIHGWQETFGMPSVETPSCTFGDDIDLSVGLTPEVLKTLPQQIPLEPSDSRAFIDCAGSEESESDETRLNREIEAGFYQVEKIIASGVYGDRRLRQVYIRCRWTGYNAFEDTWEPLTTLGKPYEHRAYLAWRETGFEQTLCDVPARSEPADARGRLLPCADGLTGFCMSCCGESLYGHLCSACLQPPESYTVQYPKVE